ncbi:hypothetical protein MKZ17_10960 [Solibacillus sp. FSL R7-0682]|uniref:hypothetical protein n=1 Tax=Solibacillus sp. FSL R7-0682 TaxID=2921690 RepID=UPI0030F9A695
MNRFNDFILDLNFQSIESNYILNPNLPNKRTIKGFVTNHELNPISSFHFHSLAPFKRGEHVEIDGNDYLVMTDVITNRVQKRKAIVTYCNFTHDKIMIDKVLVGYDDLGRPIYEDKEVDYGIEYGVLKYKDVSIPTNETINLIRTVYDLSITDNEVNRRYFTYDKVLTFEGRTYRITDLVFTNKGLIVARLQ